MVEAPRPCCSSVACDSGLRDGCRARVGEGGTSMDVATVTTLDHENLHFSQPFMIPPMDPNHEPPHHGQDTAYPSSSWIEIPGYHPSQHQSPEQEYSGFNFVPTPHPAMALEASYGSMNPPPHPAHQPLRQLAMPPWPSTLTTQSAYSASILPTAPHPLPLPAPVSSHPGHTTSTPRRTLTDADRRRMCVYHEENPTVKQTEIGGEDRLDQGVRSAR